jgi:hypothetical protein
METIINTLKPYPDLLQEKRQIEKQLKLHIFLKKPVQKDTSETSSKTADEQLPSTTNERTQKPPALFLNQQNEENDNLKLPNLLQLR